MLQLDDGWDARTQQKLALAGCLALGLSVRRSPIATGSRLRDFAQKAVGYGSAAVIFSGVQETCRAVRGRHDFLNSALSGAVTGGLVVGFYQGARYRLLGVVTWGSVCAALHLANAALRPRHLLEDYLIREGLLSPEVARRRELEALRSGRGGAGAGAALEQRDVFLEALAVRERELRALNDRLASEHAARSADVGGDNDRAAVLAGGGAAANATAAAGLDEGTDVADDDPGYVAWLRSSGLDAEALLQPSALPSGSASPPAGTGMLAQGGMPAAVGGGDGDGGSAAAGAATAGAPAKRRTWREWLRLGSEKAALENASARELVE